MDAIKDLLTLQGTMLVLLLSGFILRKRSIITTEFRKALTNFILSFILPASIVKSYLMAFDLQILLDCMAVMIVSCATQAMTIFLGKLLFSRVEERKRPCILYATQVSNAGFLGSPIAEGLYGAQGLLYASVYLIPQRIMMWSVGVACFSGAWGKGVVKKVLTNPCIVAVGIGLVLMLTQIQLPVWLEQPLSMTGGCNTALSLIVLGSVLGEAEPKNLLRKETILYCAVRLVLIPLIVLVCGRMIGLEALVLKTSVVLAGMPAAVTTAMLASRHGADEEFAVSLVFLSTIGSMVTIPMLSLLMTLI